MANDAKSILNWFRSHLLVVLGVALLLAVIALTFAGVLAPDQAAGAAVFALALLGVHVKLDQVHAAVAATAAAGADYRAGNKAAVVQDLKPVVSQVLTASPQLTLTLAGDAAHVLSAATAIQTQPATSVNVVSTPIDGAALAKAVADIHDAQAKG